MRRSLNKIMPAFGYLQISRGKLMGQSQGHIESGPRSIKRTLPTYLTEIHPSNEDDPIGLPAAIIDADDKYTEHDQILRPHFNEGPSRFSLARDALQDCVALLIDKTFLDRLQTSFNQYRKLGLLEGSLYLAKKKTSQCRSLYESTVNDFQIKYTDSSASRVRHALQCCRFQ